MSYLPQYHPLSHPEDMVVISAKDLESSLMKDILNKINELAHTSSNIIISGEQGAGKRWLASMIHYRDVQPDSDMIYVNCDQIPAVGLESMLNSTMEQRVNGGPCNILIDNFSGLNASYQAYLLESILKHQGGELEGCVAPENCRYIFTISNTWQQQNKGHYMWTYLTDLLNPISILIPPLREHREDIKPLSGIFLRQIARQHDHEKATLRQMRMSEEALRKCISYPWPGNLRQFKNALTHAYFSAHSEVIQPEDLPVSLNISTIYDPQLMDHNRSWSYMNAERKLKDHKPDQSSLRDLNLKGFIQKFISNR